ncbi:MAG: HAMP domain-containing histidine kinase [Verrucomicrobiales bacterium]|jgi:signal transduction histidine kinase|nr:HAMP domain-containing histidine kinase [Verrucomicrobiales bacterium]
MSSMVAKLTVAYTLIVILTMLVMLALGRFILEAEMVRGVDLLNKAEFREIRNRMVKGSLVLPEQSFIGDVQRDAVVDASLYYLQIRRPDGSILYKSQDAGDFELPPPAPDQDNWFYNSTTLGELRVGKYSVGPYEIQVASSVENIRVLSKRYYGICGILLAVILVISVPTGYLLSRYAFSPIRRIQRTAARISAENLRERIPERSARDEVADLIRLLNAMFDRLEISFTKLWQFSGYASHELKTPLALIKLYAERLLLGGGLDTKQKEAVQQQMECVDHLHSVIQKLLFIARPEAGEEGLNLKPQQTSDLVRTFAEDAEVLCEEAKLNFEVAANDKLTMSIDAPLITQVWFNLLSNAIKASKPGATIRFSSVGNDRRWQVVISDQGRGLPGAELKNIFQPFYKLQGDPGDESQGSGLGLAICEKIIKMHHGEIRAVNNAGGPGLTITILIPLRH